MTDKYNTVDLVAYAVDQKPIEFAKTFGELALEKIQAKIADKKLEVAQSMFVKNEPETQEEEDGEES